MASNNSRYIITELQDPVNSVIKNRRPAVIPPFSFLGELETGISGFWYPPSHMMLTYVSLTASGRGEGVARVAVLREEPFTGRPLVLANFVLGANQKKITKRLDYINVTPYDKIFVASYTDSFHTGVVVQLVGEMMS